MIFENKYDQIETEKTEEIINLLESTRIKLHTYNAKRTIEITQEYFKIGIRNVETSQLQSEIDKFYLDLSWYNKIFTKFRIKKIPVRIEACKKAIYDRLENRVKN